MDGFVKSIGADSLLKGLNCLSPTRSLTVIDEELILFFNVSALELSSGANRTLLMQRDGNLEPDSFEHEQNVLICARTTVLLILWSKLVR